MLPGNLSNTCYVMLQKWCGNIRNETESRIEAGCQIARIVAGRLRGSTLLEVGTGKRLNVPIVLWLLGARETITMDLNNYLRPEFVAADIMYYRDRRSWIEETLSKVNGSDDFGCRLELLLSLKGATDRALLEHIMDLCRIRYLAPADAARIDQYGRAIDIHFSTNVLEHIHPGELKRILSAAARALKQAGMCIHIVDLSDHFAHNDGRISRINFLRFDDAKWKRYAGNQFMYMNRLRASEYVQMFENSGFLIRDISTVVDSHCLDVVRSGGVPLAGRFLDMEAEDLATTKLVVVGVPKTAV